MAWDGVGGRVGVGDRSGAVTPMYICQDHNPICMM